MSHASIPTTPCYSKAIHHANNMVGIVVIM